MFINQSNIYTKTFNNIELTFFDFNNAHKIDIKYNGINMITFNNGYIMYHNESKFIDMCFDNQYYMLKTIVYEDYILFDNEDDVYNEQIKLYVKNCLKILIQNFSYNNYRYIIYFITNTTNLPIYYGSRNYNKQLINRSFIGNEINKISSNYDFNKLPPYYYIKESDLYIDKHKYNQEYKLFKRIERFIIIDHDIDDKKIKYNKICTFDLMLNINLQIDYKKFNNKTTLFINDDLCLIYNEYWRVCKLIKSDVSQLIKNYIKYPFENKNKLLEYLESPNNLCYKSLIFDQCYYGYFIENDEIDIDFNFDFNYVITENYITINALDQTLKKYSNIFDETFWYDFLLTQNIINDKDYGIIINY